VHSSVMIFGITVVMLCWEMWHFEVCIGMDKTSVKSKTLLSNKLRPEIVSTLIML